jgi:hypothetical protein
MTTGPLRRVLDAIDAGASTPQEIRVRTGLSADMVGTALDQLRRMGRLPAQEVPTGCATGGCGGCAVASCGSRLLGLPQTR